MSITDLIGLLLGGSFVFLGLFVLFPMLLYIYNKRIKLVEDILEDGREYFSLNIFLTGHGTLHYASVFMFDWYAKRYNLLHLKDNVPPKITGIFKIYYVIFMIDMLCFAAMIILDYIYPNIK
ncbi:hypothetical protein H5125_15195 [Shewanella sp. SR44-4]|jgi:sulfoxide reductase heme-binding subunit YedZ|uniref:hypothetical protein n=1 Tax=unclassified Shewanella TaxID=196818 RepID=UPI0016004700|nr:MULTISPECIES: hypothetical protein [unclassified Shewanella]MBB1363492.1 hypothetical protein [Shewanella sp. SR44-4]MBO1897830.1 hypothetical protein [Shewanella sp. BF02_Schw]